MFQLEKPFPLHNITFSSILYIEKFEPIEHLLQVSCLPCTCTYYPRLGLHERDKTERNNMSLLGSSGH